MTCHDIKNAIAAYVAGQLPKQRSILISEHLKVCRECRLWYREVKEGFVEWENMDTASVSEQSADRPNLVPNVMLQIERLPQVEPELQKQPDRKLSQPRQTQDPKPSNPKLIVKRLAVYHYAVAASLAFVMLQTGMFQKITSGISQLNVQMSDKVQSLAQLLSHL